MWLSILINSDISHSKYLHKSSKYLNDIDDVSPFIILFRFLLVIFIFWHSQYLDLFCFLDVEIVILIIKMQVCFFGGVMQVHLLGEMAFVQFLFRNRKINIKNFTNTQFKKIKATKLT